MPTTDPVVNGTNVSDGQSGGGALLESVQAFGTDLMQQLPEILGALVVLIVGWIIASALGRLVRRLVVWSRVDRLIQSADADTGTLDQVNIKYRGDPDPDRLYWLGGYDGFGWWLSLWSWWPRQGSRDSGSCQTSASDGRVAYLIRNKTNTQPDRLRVCF